MVRLSDYYTKLAKRSGFPARSVFKLQEIDTKYKLFNNANQKYLNVLDLGCNPGSWSLYASEKIKSNGTIYSIDKRSQPACLQNIPNIKFIQQDVFEWKDLSYLNNHIDVIMSDMAPNTTGHHDIDSSVSLDLCYATLQIADDVLVDNNGIILMKILQGFGFNELISDLRKKYKKVRVVKPKSSRKESTEIFLLGNSLFDRTHL